MQEMVRHLKYDVRDVSELLEGIDIEEEPEEDIINYTNETVSLIVDRVIYSLPKDLNTNEDT